MQTFERFLNLKIEEQNSVLRSYDEILCDKAQKHTVKELQTLIAK